MLSIALQVKGPFRKFKDTVIYLGIVDGWYQYRDKQYQKSLLEWCEIEGIKVEHNCSEKK